MEFIHSGYAILGIEPGDKTAKLVELNHKEETNTMTDAEIKALIEQTVSIYTNQVAEINQCKADCESKIAELNETVETITNEKNEIAANAEAIQKALDELRAEFEKNRKEYDALWAEREELEKALGEARAKERLGELNAALAEFSDDEKAYAQAEIDAFNANPVESEINSVVDKILIGIGKKARDEAAAKVTAEQNAAKEDVSIEDIFSAVEEPAAAEDTNIF